MNQPPIFKLRLEDQHRFGFEEERWSSIAVRQTFFGM